VAPQTTQLSERTQSRQKVWPQGVVCGRQRMDLQTTQCNDERREVALFEVKPSGHCERASEA